MNQAAIQTYLGQREAAPVELVEIRELGGEAAGSAALKQFGYGRPLLVRYEASGQARSVVIHRVTQNAFGRELPSDRVAAVWLDYQSFNLLPQHSPALDMLVLAEDGSLRSIGDGDDLLLVTAYRPGTPYAEDLIRIRDEGQLQDLDIPRAEALAEYLAFIHQTAHDDPALWRRRLRDLIGHGEGIFGMADNYPDDAQFTSAKELLSIEQAANRWRWKLKPLSHRLRQVHGDFHPFNVLFDSRVDFHVLDRSRGIWGEPADDVSAMTINYLFFSLQRRGRFEDPFDRLHSRFWEAYLDQRPDEEILSVIQPWLAWRALVVASPVWYPDIEPSVRRTLLDFARNVMAGKTYDFANLRSYLSPAKA